MTDAYVSATKIPNFFTTLFGEGSLGTVFIPIYNRGMEEKGKERTDDFVFSLLNLIVAFTSTLSVIMIFFSKQIPILYDTAHDAAQTYGVFSIPCTYFIDADGMLTAQARGAINKETLERGIDMIVKQ